MGLTSRQRIGFMQGRLSPKVDGKIQAFPWAHWRDEFPEAARLALPLMEWTLDHERLDENPLMTAEGRREIALLSERHGVQVRSVTGDCFMQAPFWRTPARGGLEAAPLLAVAEACAALGPGQVVVLPLVDNGALKSRDEEDALVAVLSRAGDALDQLGVRVALESDYPPSELARLLERLPGAYGVNLDLGNSASLGFDPGEEVAAFGARITHVHVKDRLLGGTTVPLGTGAARLPQAFQALSARGYRGNFVLQTARAVDDDHAGALLRYRELTAQWIDFAAS